MEDAVPPSGGLDPSLPNGARVGDFVIIRLLGRGGMGEVYLARDQQLARRVALKVIRPSFLGTLGSAQSFLDEARAAARFNHPNIVVVYATGEHEGLPYVAFEYLDGEDLRDRMTEARLPPREWMRLCQPIALALAEAHRQNLVHGDLKPANVFIAADGRPRLLDFGLARHLGGPPEPRRPGEVGAIPIDTNGETVPAASLPSGAQSGTTIAGTPGYMAPEQWVGEALDGATDVWALGVMMFELSTGTRPFIADTYQAQAAAVCFEPTPHPASLEALPGRIAELIHSCLAKDPHERPTAEAIAQVLDAALHPERHLGEDDDVGPYRGLMPFGEGDAALFHGRDAPIAALLERLREQPVIPVVGASGIGKSSLVRAGVIPRLVELGYHVVTLRPRDRPFVALARQLTLLGEGDVDTDAESGDAAPGSRGATLAATLAGDPRELSRRLFRAAERLDCRILLFVDQLEELFTHGHDAGLVDAFVRAVCGAAADPTDPLRVIFTVRVDFLDRLATSAARDALARVVLLQRLDAAALEETLTRPLALTGYRFEDADMPREMVAEVAAEPACLPLLSFAAQRLWEQRDRESKLLLRSAYEQMGGIAGALANHADAMVTSLSAAERRVARAVVLRLVTSDHTRKLVPRGRAEAGLGDDAGAVVDKLVDARLLSVSQTESDDAQLELAHESLIGTWRRLARWLDDEREEHAFVEEVEQAAALWERRGCHATELWQGDALRDARRTLERSTVALPATSQRFLDAAQQLAESQGRRRRNAIAGVIAAVTVVMGILLWQERKASALRDAAEEQRDEAELQRKSAITAQARTLVESAQAAFERSEPLVALSQVRAALEQRDDLAARALWRRIASAPLTMRHVLASPAQGVAMHGPLIAAATVSGAIYLVDRRSGETRRLRGHGDQVSAVDFSPRGDRLVSASVSGACRLWEVTTGKPIAELQTGDSEGWAVAFVDDERVACGGRRTVHLWTPSSGAKVELERDDPSTVFGLAVSRGRTMLAAAGDGGAELWDVTSGRRLRPLVQSKGLRWVAFSNDDALVAGGGSIGDVLIWRTADGSLVRRLESRGGESWGGAFHPSGELLASANYDKRVRLWNPSDGALVATLGDHRAEAYDVAFDETGEYLATSGWGGEVRSWSVARAREQPITQGHRDAVYDVAVDPQTDRVASGGLDGVLRIWDPESGRQIEARAGSGNVLAVSYSHDGERLGTSHGDVVAIWDRQGRQVLRLVGHAGDIWDVAFSHAGDLVASTGSDGLVRLWDASSGESLQVLRGHHSRGTAVRFTPSDERLLSVSRDGTLRVWDVATGAALRALDVGPWAVGATLPRGSNRFFAAFGEEIHGWSLGDFEPLPLRWGLVGGRLYGLDATEDGRFAAAGSNGNVYLWREQDDEPRAIGSHAAEANDVAFSRDGRLLASGGDDSTVRLWDGRTGRPRWHAPVMLPSPPRLISHRGVERLDGGGGGSVEALEAMLDVRGSSVGGDGLCVVTPSRGAELRRASRYDERLAAGGRDVLEVAAGPAGCLARSAESVWLLRPDGSVTDVTLSGPPTALGGGDHLAVVASRRASRVGEGGEIEGVALEADAVAIAWLGSDGLIAGYRDGQVVRIADGATLTFSDLPAALPLRIVSGPAGTGTVAISFGDGTVGLWDRQGRRLRSGHLHGRVEHLRLEGHRLYAASILGDHLAWDLADLTAPWCEVLDAVWAEAAATYRDGRVVMASPGDHACRER